MMQNRHRPWLALLISALVHVCAVLALIGHASRPGAEAGSGAQSGQALVVHLLAAARAAPHGEVPAVAKDPSPHAAAQSPRNLPASAEAVAAGDTPSTDAEAGATGARPVEHHYFGAGEVTEPAVVADGLANDEWLIVPGLKPQTIDLQVWVSDEGLVDRVELESPLPEAEKQLLLAAFAKVRFLPGRIGRIAVHSKLSMRIRVDYTLRA